MKTELSISLGGRIRAARKKHKITQLNLAGAVGLASPSYLCEIEKGKKLPSIDTLFRIEQLLGPVWESPK